MVVGETGPPPTYNQLKRESLALAPLPSGDKLSRPVRRPRPLVPSAGLGPARQKSNERPRDDLEYTSIKAKDRAGNAAGSEEQKNCWSV